MFDRFISFLRENSELLIALSLALSLLALYQNRQDDQVRWVDGWDCQYWAAEANSYQSLIDSTFLSLINGNDENLNTVQNWMTKRDDAEEKFNLKCLPKYASFLGDN